MSIQSTIKKFKHIIASAIALLTFCIPLFVLPGVVSAAPAQWGIAINKETEECAGYWAGDEFSQHPLPEGWIDYYPDYSGDIDTIETPFGTCTFTSEEDCCEQLGLTYVSDNIGHEDNFIEDDLLDEPLVGGLDAQPAIAFFLVTTCCCLGGILFIVISIVTIAARKKPAQEKKE